MKWWVPRWGANPWIRSRGLQLNGELASRFSFVSTSTRMGKWRYLAYVAVTGLAAALQLVFLPRYLDPYALGLLALGMSATQGIQQLADLGFGNASSRVNLSKALRASFREAGLTLSTLVSAAVLVVLMLSGIFAHSGWDAVFVLGASVATGWVLMSSKMRAGARVESGNERSAAIENLIWQNSPKLGLVAGAFSGSALMASGAALVGAALIGRQKTPLRIPRLGFLRSNRTYWLPGLVLVSAAFLMSWADTYIVVYLLSVDVAGQYQAVLRPLLGSTYLYLPIVGMILVAMNRGETGRTWRLSWLAMGLTAAALAMVSIGLVFFGSRVWPMYVFDFDVVVLSAISVFLGAASTVFGTQLLAAGKQLTSALATGAGCIVLVTLGAILIPPLGLAGAAAAACCAWAVPSSIQFGVAIRLARLKAVSPDGFNV
jgi:O-antigen/teichoic acid export membrane protein